MTCSRDSHPPVGRLNNRANIAAAVLSVTLALTSAVAGAPDVDSVLADTYGPETAGKCRDYLKAESLPPEERTAVLEAVQLIARAGYPGNCTVEYFALAASLTKADIGLGDLTNKIREGIAKGVDASRLIHVLERRAEALREGKEMTLELEGEGIGFLDRQMAYTVLADYFLRGVKPEDLMADIRDGTLREYPALEKVMR